MAITRDDLLNQARQNIHIINADEAETFMASGATVLDIREPAEFDMGHLPEAVHIPRGLLEFMVGNHPKLSDFKQPLATDLLQSMGFEDIHMLAGGFDNWSGTVHKVEVAANQYT